MSAGVGRHQRVAIAKLAGQLDLTGNVRDLLEGVTCHLSGVGRSATSGNVNGVDLRQQGVGIRAQTGLEHPTLGHAALQAAWKAMMATDAGKSADAAALTALWEARRAEALSSL